MTLAAVVRTRCAAKKLSASSMTRLPADPWGPAQASRRPHPHSWQIAGNLEESSCKVEGAL